MNKHALRPLAAALALAASALAVALSTFIWLLARKAPAAAPKMVIISNGSACSQPEKRAQLQRAISCMRGAFAKWNAAAISC